MNEAYYGDFNADNTEHEFLCWVACLEILHYLALADCRFAPNPPYPCFAHSGIHDRTMDQGRKTANNMHDLMKYERNFNPRKLDR